MKKIILSLLLASTCAAQEIPAKYFVALNQVEYNGRSGLIWADHHTAIGGFCIHKQYWLDATRADKTIGGTWESCADYSYSVRIITAYAKRYEPAAVKSNDFETLARLHNAGWNWRKNRRLTDGYWEKVKTQLK